MKLASSVTLLVAILIAAPAFAFDDNNPPGCSNLPTEAQLKSHLVSAATSGGEAGGLFHGTRMWAAVVNRKGQLCAYAASQQDETQVWPGSQAIAKSKAYTANAFSLDNFALSTARLYTFTQPGHSLWSLGFSNAFNPRYLSSPENDDKGDGRITGGMIFFGGGVPLYKQGKIIGGLGVSGDTSCTDHEIAKRVRNPFGLNPTGGALVDDISYSSVDGANVFTHPLCLNTYRNGVFIGNEAAATNY